jgi:hypothetical protein
MTFEEELLKYPTRYLSDGAYATHRGYDIVIWAKRYHDIHWVSLDPCAIKMLQAFDKEIANGLAKEETPHGQT